MKHFLQPSMKSVEKYAIFGVLMLLFGVRESKGLREAFSREPAYVENAEIREVRDLAKNNAFLEYSLSDSLNYEGNPWIFQQVLMELWPSKFNVDSRRKFALEQDPAADCKIIDRRKKVVFVECP